MLKYYRKNMHNAKKVKMFGCNGYNYLVRSRSRGNVSDCGVRGSDLDSRPKQAILGFFVF